MKTTTKATKIGSCLCSFLTWVFLVTAFAYYADKIHSDVEELKDSLAASGVDCTVTYGPGFGVTVAAFCVAFINMFCPFLAREADTDGAKQPPRQSPGATSSV